MRKVLTYTLIIAILSGIFIFPVSATESENTAELTDAEKTLIGLGVVDMEEYNPNALLSRAEFASLISALCEFVPANQAYLDNIETTFGEDNKDELITSSGGMIFADVDSTMEEFEAINAMYTNGYMTGITSELFGPHYDITASEVIKVLVSMLGRDNFAKYKGGYPIGYMTVASEIKLMKGLELGQSDFITLKETLGLLYNAFDINVYKLTKVDGDGAVEYTDSGETFLNYYASVYTVEGNMTDNGITTYYGKSKVGQNKVVIGDVSMYIGNADYARNYLGRELTAYYTEDDDGVQYLRYATADNDNSRTFDAEDFASYTSSEIKYYNENGKLITASLSDVNVIYNNSVRDRYNEDTFRFLFGDITLTSTSGSSKYDVIIVNDYMVGKINKISSSDKVVYCDTLYENMGDIKLLNLEEDSDKTVIITDSDGNKVDFDALASGNVISVTKNDDGSYISVKVCNATVKNFAISSFSTQDKLSVTNGTDTYTLQGVSQLSEGINLRLGEYYDLYLDYKGNLIYFEALADSTNLKKGFLIDAKQIAGGLSETYAVKLCTQEGKFGVYEMEDKVLLNHSSAKSNQAISEIQSAIGTIVLYRTDTDGKILKAMVTPLEFGAADTDDRGWYAVVPYVRLSAEKNETPEEFKNYLATDGIGNKFVFESNGNMLDKSMIYNEKSSILFAVPSTKEEYSEEKKFYVDRLKFETNKGYYLNAYDTDADSIAPDAIAFSNGGGSASGDSVSERKAFLITGITTTLNSDEEAAKAYKGYLLDADSQSATETVFTVSTEVEFVDADNKIGAPAVELEAGDIIRYGINSDGDISAIFVAYDMSAARAYPFGLTSLDWRAGDTYTGYVYAVDGNYARITADEPHLVPTEANAMYNYFTTRNTSLVHTIGKVILLVEKDRNGITVRSGTKDDIISYRESGNITSGTYDKFVGVEYAWGHTIATIIYK